MNKQDIFDAWAPADAIWSPWVKPVLFSQLDAIHQDTVVSVAMPDLSPKPEPTDDVSWAVDSNRTTAIVIDLPGDQGIALALRLATMGYRPVPLYNACPAPTDTAALVDVRPMMAALVAGASSILAAGLPSDAPPVFLLDANRNPAVRPAPGQFDNRSISLPTDFPSAHLLLSHGIKRAVLMQPRCGEPPADLSHTLLRWQEAGVEILALAVDEPGLPRSISVSRPKAYRMLWYGLLAKLGFQASPLGGFGGRLPMPSSG